MIIQDTYERCSPQIKSPTVSFHVTVGSFQPGGVTTVMPYTSGITLVTLSASALFVCLHWMRSDSVESRSPPLQQ